MSADRERLIQEALEYDPNDPLLHFTYGNFLMEQKRLEEAAAAYRRAVELDADYSAAWLALGTALVALNEEEAAREALQTAAEVAQRKRDLKVRREALEELQRLDEF
ncbi:MAG: hypothetical protein KatS3mg115_1083 [Candidatus Poribacteria bacterium]|nr:MAG: hypothetical protein KatS3mg115_1083 [Candidatus Poribacteria bacterium]